MTATITARSSSSSSSSSSLRRTTAALTITTILIASLDNSIPRAVSFQPAPVAAFGRRRSPSSSPLLPPGTFVGVSSRGTSARCDSTTASLPYHSSGGGSTTTAIQMGSTSSTASSAKEEKRGSATAAVVDEEEEEESPSNNNEIMWSPDPQTVQETAMRAFQKQTVGVDGTQTYEDLWRWSIEHSDDFWTQLLDFTEVIYEGSTTRVKRGTVMPDVTYFPNVKLNFAENLLKHSQPGCELEHSEALVSVSEAYKFMDHDTLRWSFGELRDDASRIRSALDKLGVTSEDAVGAYLPNVGEAVVAMLGTTAVGATWSSCSPDFGARAVADRFGQIGPKVLFVVDGYVSRGKGVDVREAVEELVGELKDTLVKVVILPLLPSAEEEEDDNKKESSPWKTDLMKELAVSYDEFLQSGSNEDGSAPEPKYERVPFAHPQFVLYSSGTTGQPKSIAHGTGNVLLQHAKELLLHTDLRPKDRMLYFTSTGWMMWNWMVSSLYAGATVVTFDGFAAYPRLSSPWDLVEKEQITHMGTTPRYLQACRARIRPGEKNDLSNLRVMLSTGSPLAPEDFDYVYGKVKEDLLLASISGGTDICSCFALGNPTLPVRKGELQSFGLGLDVCAYDVDEKKSAAFGEKGELVCKSPFVAAPVCFFGDDENMSKYRGAYFRDEDEETGEKLEKDDPTIGYWYHGDLVEVTGSIGRCGGVVIHGRSDTTLKPGGVRIGTAEVYRFAEEVPAVQDSLVIGDKIVGGKRSGDVRIVLFVKLTDGLELNSELEEEIRSTIRSGASEYHVPAVIRQVKAIPYTRSGKKVELAVRDLFAGVEPKNVGALQDPAAFDEYRLMAEEGLCEKGLRCAVE